MSKKKHLTKRQKMRKRRKRILITELVVLLLLSGFLLNTDSIDKEKISDFVDEINKL